MATVNPTSNSATFVPPPAPKPRSELNMQTFLRLLTVQLANQNPLEPMSDRDFFAQLAQLGQVEGMDSIKKSMEIAQAGSMMGKQVTAFRPMTDGDVVENQNVKGEVTRVFSKNGEYWLSLKQSNGGLVDVRLSAVQEISNS